jgi:hypothetical protein
MKAESTLSSCAAGGHRALRAQHPQARTYGVTRQIVYEAISWSDRILKRASWSRSERAQKIQEADSHEA